MVSAFYKSALELSRPGWMVASFVACAIGALISADEARSATVWMCLPFGILTVALIAATIALPRFRADLPLLVFHLSLLAVVVVFVLARLTYFNGTTAVDESEFFFRRPNHDRTGPLSF